MYHGIWKALFLLGSLLVFAKEFIIKGKSFFLKTATLLSQSNFVIILPLWILCTLILHTKFYTIGCCCRAVLVSCLQNQVTSCKKEKVYCKQCFWQSMNSSWIIIEASNFKTNHQWGCWYYIQHTMVHKRNNSRQQATSKVIYPKYYKYLAYVLANEISFVCISLFLTEKNTL